MVLPTDDVVVALSDHTLIVQPERAKAQRDGEPGVDGTVVGDADGNGSPEPPEPEPTGPASKTRFFGSKELQPDRYAIDFKKVADEILAPLLSVDGATLKISVDIEVTAADGFDESKVRTVSENANVLKFDTADFEE